MRIRAEVQNEAQVARAFRRAPRIMRARTDTYARRAALELAREARRLAPKASSTLAQSIRPDKLAEMDYLIGPHAQHGVHVELGRKPGGRMPPPQAILDWLKSRGVRSLQGGEPREAAWAMARKIQQRGIAPQPYMAPARDAMADRVRILIAQGIRRGLRDAGLA